MQPLQEIHRARGRSVARKWSLQRILACLSLWMGVEHLSPVPCYSSVFFLGQEMGFIHHFLARVMYPASELQPPSCSWVLSALQGCKDIPCLGMQHGENPSQTPASFLYQLLTFRTPLHEKSLDGDRRGGMQQV